MVKPSRMPLSRILVIAVLVITLISMFDSEIEDLVDDVFGDSGSQSEGFSSSGSFSLNASESETAIAGDEEQMRAIRMAEGLLERHLSESVTRELLENSYGVAPETIDWVIVTLHPDWDAAALTTGIRLREQYSLSRIDVYEMLQSDNYRFTQDQADYALEHLR